MRELITKYDEDADVLYVSFYNPPLEADDSGISQRDKNCILRYKGEELIGVTILNWSKSKEEEKPK